MVVVNGVTISPSQKRVLYIMGDGRSGSTILSIILGNHSQIQAVGELDKWALFGGKPKRGNTKDSDLDFWAGVLSRYADRSWSGSFENILKAQSVVERYKFFPNVLFNRVPAWAQELYYNHDVKLITSICSCSGKDIVVDSSKNMGRALMLLRNPYLDAKVIYLVRGPRATMWSIMKKNVEQKNKTSVVGMLQYCLKNFFCLLVQWRASEGKVLRVRYEDLTLSADTELKRIGDFLGLDMESLAGEIIAKKPLSVPPLLDGNRIRLKERISVRYDNNWKTDLSTAKKFLALLITFPFSCFFGYLRNG